MGVKNFPNYPQNSIHPPLAILYRGSCLPTTPRRQKQTKPTNNTTIGYPASDQAMILSLQNTNYS